MRAAVSASRVDSRRSPDGDKHAKEYVRSRADGMRRLVWNPGVQITFDEGPTHRMCGRDGGHRH